MDESLFPSYLNNGQIRSTNAVAPAANQVPAPKPFNLTFAPPPPVYVPPLPTINTRTQAGEPTPRATPLGAPPSDNGLPKGVPANAIPVIRGLDLSYDIPGTGQRLYPTLNGGVSEYNPEQRFQLAQYTEPAQIRAGAEVQAAGIRGGAEVAAATRAQQIAQQGATTRELIQAQTKSVPIGTSIDTSAGYAVPVTNYGLPTLNPNNPTSGVTVTPFGPTADRQAVKPKVGGSYNAPDGKYGNITVKNGKVISVD